MHRDRDRRPVTNASGTEGGGGPVRTRAIYGDFCRSAHPVLQIPSGLSENERWRPLIRVGVGIPSTTAQVAGLGKKMANPSLAKSSVVAVVLHLWANFILGWDTWWVWTSPMIFPTLSRIFCQLGTFTSVWNHSVTTLTAKAVDRYTVRIAATLDILSVPSLPRLDLQVLVTSMLLVTLLSYIGAKRADGQVDTARTPAERDRFKLQRDVLHIRVHASTTVANIIIAAYAGAAANTAKEI